ncbi:MAG: hypothetical protein HYS05_16690 [Acidobacteria bacterium]|nr:hypothetical protein [Acidobacteriota bacterium]
MTSRFFTLLGAVALGVALLAPLAAADQTTFDGKPAFKEGHDLGYFVWKDGNTWKVRWTTFGATHRFTGSVVADTGEIESLKRIDVDAERKVIHPGRPGHLTVGPRGRVRRVGGRRAVVAMRDEDHINMDGRRTIRFQARTDDDIDGFDFKTTGDVKVLRFVLEIDGKPRAASVEVGRNNEHPANNPFVVNLR